MIEAETPRPPGEPARTGRRLTGATDFALHSAVGPMTSAEVPAARTASQHIASVR